MYGPNILLISDDPIALRDRAGVLAAGGHEVEIALGHDRGILACSSRTFDVIIIEARSEFAAEKLAMDIAVVAPASEVVNVNRWRNAGLSHQDEPGFLLSLVAAVVRPANIRPEHAATHRMRRRNER